MINIGLVGEDPNDTTSIKNLLSKKYSKKVNFFPLANRIKGHQLDNPKIKKSLPIEFEDKECKFIIYIRDLDGFKSEKDKYSKKFKWFSELDACVNDEGVLLLNIWELEGLILGDIDNFNKLYNTSAKFAGDCTMVKEPKEFLKKITAKSKKKFKESHCPDIFSHLDFDKIKKNCTSFKEFVAEFEQKIA